MTQAERRVYLINELLKEQPRAQSVAVPQGTSAQRHLLRSLFNLRAPRKLSGEFLAIQDAYLQNETERKGVVSLRSLTPLQPELYLWQGDITTLACDAIVNAANSGMTGCYLPCHTCIDNCIHTYAGAQLRLECAELMQRQGYEEPTGSAKITSAYNLPCNYILHTVGPIIAGQVTDEDQALLAACYRSCLQLAEHHHIKSIAFCCISTGEFHFPNDKAAEIAVQTVKAYKAQTHSSIEVIFNVFKDIDYKIYRALLG